MDGKTHGGWPVRSVIPDNPPLADLVGSIQAGLEANFASVAVTVEQSPDLREKPFYLASPGLSGNTRIADVGSPKFAEPAPDMSKEYDLLSVAQTVGMSARQGVVIGASAAPIHHLGTNAEYMPNVLYEGLEGVSAKKLTNLSRYSKIDDSGSVVVEQIANDVTAFALLANLFTADGFPGPLVHVRVKGRKGQLGFSDSIRDGLKGGFGSRLISMGGVFAMSNGRANLHTMAHSVDQPFKREVKHPWLRWFNGEAPLVGLTVFHSGDDRGCQLRGEHTHCFSIDGDGLGGHFNGDVDGTRETVEYEAWLNTADIVYRIDAPML